MAGVHRFEAFEVPALRAPNPESPCKKGDAEAARTTLFAILQQADSIPIEVTELSIQRGEGTVMVLGKVRNNTLAANAPVTLTITLIGSKGQDIGHLTTTVNMGARDAVTPFEQHTPVTGLVAGWKYEVARSG